MTDAPSLPVALRWLMEDLRWSPGDLALRAGVPPASAAALLARTDGPIATWLTLLAALGAHVQLQGAGRHAVLAMPRPAAARRARERDRWRTRRLAAGRAQLARQAPDLSPTEAAATALAYARAAEARLDGDLAAARSRCDAAAPEAPAVGLRHAVRLLAGAAAVNGEDLALLAGVAHSTVQSALAADGDGRLAPLHRCCSALAARIVVLPRGGGRIPIAHAAPGPWRPGPPREGRCTLDRAEIQARAAAGESLAAIARAAGVSRQRIHALVRA
jgi:hypothetical protein